MTRSHIQCEHSHLGSVDGLRGLAALTIVVYHLFTNSGNPNWRPFGGLNLLRPLHDGWAGVNLFLVLSGFCLYWPFARRPDRPMDLLEYAKRRSRRILPAYYFSLLAVPLAYWLLHKLGLVAAGSLPLPRSWIDSVLHTVLLHSLWGESIRSWNGVTWSLGLEWLWYMVFPLAVIVFRKRGVLVALLAATAVTVTYRCGFYVLWRAYPRIAPVDPEAAFAYRVFVVGRLVEFALGMMVAGLLAQGRIRLPFMASAAAFCALLGIGHATTPVHVILPVRDIVYGAAFALLLALCVDPKRNLVRRLAQHRWLIWTGESSYSLYLLHMPLVSFTTYMLRRAIDSGVIVFFVSLISVPIIVLTARLAFVAVERPFMPGPRAAVPALPAGVAH